MNNSIEYDSEIMFVKKNLKNAVEYGCAPFKLSPLMREILRIKAGDKNMK